MFCENDCSTCLFLRESWDSWSFRTLRNIPSQQIQENLWEELLKIGAKVNSGKPEKFMLHLAEKYHLYLLFLEDKLQKGERKEHYFHNHQDQDKIVHFYIDDQGKSVSLSFEEYKLFAIRTLADLHLCLLHHGYLSRWLIEVYRIVRILKLIQSCSDDPSGNNCETRWNVWDLMISHPEMIRRFACNVLSRLSIIISHGMEYDISVVLFSFLKTEKDFNYPFQPVYHHFVGKESSTLLQKLISEDFETVYRAGMLSSNHYTHRPKFINLEQNWDRLVFCFRKWNGEIRDGNAGILDACIIRSIFEELLPDNIEAFSKRWLHMLFQECIHGEEQTLANIQKLGVATSLERLHHLQSRMNPSSANQKRPLQDHLEQDFSYFFRGRERFFMEMIELADSCRWNSCLIQLIHLMIEKIIQHLDQLTIHEGSQEYGVSYREQCIVDCVLYGRLATKILALLLTLTGPHAIRNSSHHRTSGTHKHYVHRKNSFQRKATETTTLRRVSSETNDNDANSLSYFLRNLHFDEEQVSVKPTLSTTLNSIASNYWLLYTNSFTYLKYAIELLPKRFSYSLSLFILWTPYLAVASVDDIISQTPWFTQCIGWIKHLREDLYSCLLNSEKMEELDHCGAICIYGWTLMLTIMEEQIPLSSISSWWKPTSHEVLLTLLNIEEWSHENFISQVHDINEQKYWWLDKRLFWHCLPHMKQLHHLLHNWDEILEDPRDKLQANHSTIRGTSRKIQPSPAVLLSKSIGENCTGNDRQSSKTCFLLSNRYAEQLEPIQQLVQMVLERKLYHVLEQLEKSEALTNDIWCHSTRSSWKRTYRVCQSLYMTTVRDLLRNLDVPLDAIYRAADETYCRTIKPWLRTNDKSPLEILEWIKEDADNNFYFVQNNKEQILSHTEANGLPASEQKSNLVQVYEQLVEENPVASRLESFLLQQLQQITDLDVETYQKLGIYQLEKRWLQWISMLLETCVQIEGEQTDFPKLTEWLWKHLSYDKIHPLVQSSLALAISKTK
ncbi:hypothetical protein GpartN1_g6495.t1 [Galdieria partita]|uniref:Uncharacterized protein n=1 Tax=Galdieria partita TaxID=83374 RepID=A0A9C7Q2N4_9RHOD|nr:hypothetical protein GpartN1_g6495.t1 [Galdieria partita]